MIRLIVSDVDGTLVRDDKTLSDAVIAAVGRAQAAGLIVSIISARPPSGIAPIVARLGLTAPVGAFNGGTIVGPDGAIVSAHHLPVAVAARTFALLDRPGVTPWLFRRGLWHALTTGNRYVPRERRAAAIDPVIMPDLERLTDDVDKIVGVSNDHDALAALEAEVKAALGCEATVARSQPYYLDVTAPAANKGDGIAALAKTIGVPLDATAAFGDQYNDLPMFARAGLSVAMGQAPEAVRAQATRTTATNEQDGVAAAIEAILRG